MANEGEVIAVPWLDELLREMRSTLCDSCHGHIKVACGEGPAIEEPGIPLFRETGLKMSALLGMTKRRAAEMQDFIDDIERV